MPQPIINQNQIAANPTLKDALDILKREVFLGLNCHAIATIQEFNSEMQTVKASVNYQKTFFKLNDQGVYQSYTRPYPVLVDCPAIVMGGGNAHLTFPIQQGDQALILFNDRDMDNWFDGLVNGATATQRLHSFADGIALVGLHSKLNPISNYDETMVTLRNGDAGVGVTEEKVKVFNSDTTLNTVLQDLITQIKAITTTGGQSVSAPSQAALDVVAAEIEGLLL